MGLAGASTALEDGLKLLPIPLAVARCEGVDPLEMGMLDLRGCVLCPTNLRPWSLVFACVVEVEVGWAEARW